MSHLELVVKHSDAARGIRRANEGDQSDACALTFARRRLLNGLGLAAGDASALSLSVLGAALVNFWMSGAGTIPSWTWTLMPLTWTTGHMLRLLPSWDLVRVEELRRTALMLSLAFGSTATVLFLDASTATESRLILGVGFGLAIILVPLCRWQVRQTLRRADLWGVPTVIYGAGSFGREVVNMLNREQGLGFTPTAFLDDNPRFWGRTVEGVRVLGSTDHVTPDAAVAILAMPGIGAVRRRDLLRGPLARYRKVFVIPDGFGAPAPWTRPRSGTGLLGLEISSNLVDPVTRWGKRLLDLAFAVSTIALWLPLLGILSIVIRLETRANPLFRQARVGRGGETIHVWRFRTTVADAENILRRTLEEDAIARTEWETTYILRRDPRVSRIGRLLRRTSLDKLPQMINVLRGDMSVVGPTPLPAHHHHSLPSHIRRARLQALPGMTGLGRVLDATDSGMEPGRRDDVHGDSETEAPHRWDAHYVANWCFWLDVVVLVRTCGRGLRKPQST